MELEPTHAWLVGPTGIATGKLSLDEGELLLRDGERTEARLPLVEVTSLRRFRATPVIELRRRLHDRDERLLLYFATPPGSGAWHEETMGAPRNGLERAVGVLRLRAANRDRKHEVRAWEERIRRELRL